MSCDENARDKSRNQREYRRISTDVGSHPLRRADAADYIGMSVSWLNKAAVFGTGPRFIKIGRSVRYWRSDLDEFLATKLRKSTSDDFNAVRR
jgi:predicted DNA-binding transcriptional regulator AlpA